MENDKALEILQQMHDRTVADAENKEQRVAKLNEEYAAGDTHPDTLNAINHYVERGVKLRVEAEALDTAIEAMHRLAGLDK